MNREDILHLGELARIELTDNELESLTSDLPAIVEYVSAVTNIAADSTNATPQVGALYNVFRQDVVQNQPDQYTNDALREMPATEGRHLKVKKILKQQ